MHSEIIPFRNARAKSEDVQSHLGRQNDAVDKNVAISSTIIQSINSNDEIIVTKVQKHRMK